MRYPTCAADVRFPYLLRAGPHGLHKSKPVRLCGRTNRISLNNEVMPCELSI